MEKSIVPDYLRLRKSLKTPLVNKEAVTINNDSKKIDKVIWELYTNCEKKIGRLGAYNNLKDFITNLNEDRNLILLDLIEAEKSFLFNLQFYGNHGFFAEVTETRSNQLIELHSKFSLTKNEKFFEYYHLQSSHKLIDKLELLKEYEKILKKVPRTELIQKSNQIIEIINRIDYLHIQYLRAKDLLKLVHKAHFSGKVNEGEFIQEEEIILRFNETEKGPSIPDELFYDFERILDGLKLIETYQNRNLPSKNTLLNEILFDDEFEKKWVNDGKDRIKDKFKDRALKGHFNDFFKFYAKLKL